MIASGDRMLLCCVPQSHTHTRKSMILQVHLLKRKQEEKEKGENDANNEHYSLLDRQGPAKHTS